MMLNPLPVQTWQRDDETNSITLERIHAYKERLIRSVKDDSLEADAAKLDDPGLALPITIAKAPPVSFNASNEWEGYVTHIGDHTFAADLVDITGKKRHETDSVEFLLSDLSPEDLTQLREGSVFRWVVGYQRLRGGTKQRVSQLYFRKMLKLSKMRSQALKKHAKNLAEALGFD